MQALRIQTLLIPQYANVADIPKAAEGEVNLASVDGKLYLKDENENVLALVAGTDAKTLPESEGNFTAKGFNISDGGTVTQATSITTGVSLNTTTGQITTQGATAVAGAEHKFTVSNSLVSATSLIVANIASYTGGGTPIVSVTAIGNGSFDITITNLHASAALDAAMVINFAVFGGSAS